MKGEPEAAPRRRRASSAAPPPLLIVVADALSFLLSYLPGILAWGFGALFLRKAYAFPAPWFVASLFLVLPIVAVTFLVVLFVLRLVVPREREGIFFLDRPNLGVAGWQCALALSRAARVAGLMAAFHSSYLSRFFYYRALGAKVALRTNMALDCFIVDPQLLTVGPDSTISFGTLISAHTVLGNKLVIIPIDIGREVFVGSHCLIGAGTKLGDNAYVGMHNQLYNVVVDSDRRIEPHEWEHGPKGADGDALV